MFPGPWIKLEPCMAFNESPALSQPGLFIHRKGVDQRVRARVLTMTLTASGLALVTPACSPAHLILLRWPLCSPTYWQTSCRRTSALTLPSPWNALPPARCMGHPLASFWFVLKITFSGRPALTAQSEILHLPSNSPSSPLRFFSL